jgi:hypothetical protein
VDELEGHDVEDESPVAEKHEQVSVPLPAEEDQHGGFWLFSRYMIVANACKLMMPVKSNN